MPVLKYHLVTVEITKESFHGGLVKVRPNSLLATRAALRHSNSWPKSVERIPIAEDPWLVPKHAESLSHESNFWYQNLLAPISTALAELTGINWSTRSWEILIGPWLRSFSFVATEKKCFLEINGLHETLETISEANLDLKEVNSMEQWTQLTLEVELHSYLFQEVAQTFGITPLREGFGARGHAVPIEQANTTRKTLGQIVHAFGKLTKNNKYMLHKTYLPRVNEARLAMALGQLPVPSDRFHKIRVRSINPSLRRILKERLKARNSRGEYAAKLFDLAADLLPTNYLEGIGDLESACKALNWPTKPRVVFDSNGYWADDVFKYYAADQVSQGSRLVVGQHGGMMGSSKWVHQLDHQLSIADKFLSWGWSSSHNKKIVPVGVLKPIREIRPKLRGSAVMPLLSLPTYPYDNSAFPIGISGWEAYFQDQLNFLKSLKKLGDEEIQIRNYPKDRGNLVTERLSEIHRRNVVQPTKPLVADLHKYRLAIVTYNSTTLLETLASNFPTVAFWNFSSWPVSEEAIEAFDGLVAAKILFSTPKAAADHLEEIWHDIDGWWLDPMVHGYRMAFADQFARKLELKNLSQTLRHEAIATYSSTI